MLLETSQEEVFRTCQAMDFEGEQAYGLSPADQIIYLSLHTFKHYADRLIWLVDLKNLLHGWQAADWDLLINRGDELGQKKAVHYIIFLLTQLFGCPLPAKVKKILDNNPLNQLEEGLLSHRLNGRSLPAWSPMILFTSGKGFYKRAVFIFESLFPRPEILRQVFANTSHLKVWQLYLKRAVQIVSHVKS